MKALLGRARANGGGVAGIDYMYASERQQIPEWVGLAEGSTFSIVSGLNEDFTPSIEGLLNGIEMRINDDFVARFTFHKEMYVG